jgi:hypothetical protein
MIRAATLLWVALAGIVGVGLFQLKHEVQSLDEELVRLNRQIAEEHRNIHVLKAEWSYINQPQRLERLAQRHLDLVPMKPQQITRLADLPRRAADGATATPMPAPGSAPGQPRPQSQLQVKAPRGAAAAEPARTTQTTIAARPVADRAAADRVAADRVATTAARQGGR